MFRFLQVKRRARGISWWNTLFWWTAVPVLLQGVGILLYRLRLHGRHNLPRTGPVLVVANHQSNFDPMLLGIAMRDRPFRGLARASLLKSLILGYLLRRFRVIPIRRGQMDMVAIRTAIEELEQGRCVAIFPEGRRSEDGELKEFKRGWWVILERTGADVLPAAIDGAFDVWPINGPMRYRGWIELEVGESIAGQSLLDMGAERGVAVLRDRIGELRGRCRARITARSGKG